jgi:hypothetical protein
LGFVFCYTQGRKARKMAMSAIGIWSWLCRTGSFRRLGRFT